jgi:hypothetical protein
MACQSTEESGEDLLEEGKETLWVDLIEKVPEGEMGLSPFIFRSSLRNMNTKDILDRWGIKKIM